MPHGLSVCARQDADLCSTSGGVEAVCPSAASINVSNILNGRCLAKITVPRGQEGKSESRQMLSALSGEGRLTWVKLALHGCLTGCYGAPTWHGF
jgi:hypothetical protein